MERIRKVCGFLSEGDILCPTGLWFILTLAVVFILFLSAAVAVMIPQGPKDLERVQMIYNFMCEHALASFLAPAFTISGIVFVVASIDESKRQRSEHEHAKRPSA
jgi:cytochrome c oxidase assembly factor CtaG